MTTMLRALLLLALAVPTSAQLLPHHSEDELPAHFAGMGKRGDLMAQRSVAIVVTSRRPDDPEKESHLHDYQDKAERALKKSSLQVVPATQNPDLTLEILAEPHLRWGQFHYQNNFYAFLLLRERSSGRLLYCSFQRAGFLHSATSALLDEFVDITRGGQLAEPGRMEFCAKVALRPL